MSEGEPAFTTNCVNCVNAFTLRRLGFEVTATGDSVGAGSASSAALKAWQDTSGAQRSFSRAIGREGAMSITETWPDGAFGWVRFTRSDRSGAHVLIVSREDGQTWFRDPQDGTMDNWDVLEAVDPGSVAVVRMDDMIPSERVRRYFERAVNDDDDS